MHKPKEEEEEEEEVVVNARLGAAGGRTNTRLGNVNGLIRAGTHVHILNTSLHSSRCILTRTS